MRSVVTPRLAVLAFSHFTIDAYSSFFSPLLPLLVAKLHLSLTLVGTLVALASLASSFSQPAFGLLADRIHRPWFIAFGPLVAAAFMSGIGMAPTFATLLTLLMLGGLGVAAFHPQAAALAREVSPRPSLAMSIFVTGGTLGYALGPLFAVTVVGTFGLERTWVAMIPGLVLACALLAWFARVQPRRRDPAARPRLAGLKPVLRPLTLLYFVVVCRSAVAFGFTTFLPLYLHRLGWSVSQGGTMLTVHLVFGALGGFLGGWLADRWGGRRVVVRSFVLATPLYLGFLFLPDWRGLVCLVAGGFFLQSSLPVNVVMGQELSPQHSSTISSLLMGAAWGVGALLIGPIGALADAQGLHAALLALAGLLAVGLMCALALPDVRRHAVPVDLAEPAIGTAGK
ncbi:MAG: MFS transporter [Candidatus Eisenbacteria bacterium]|uniref:MFS transporter n=1 Tax=Eiseniibacteriota bacterium TaxID=2212470 RepID=A0A538UD40_UNCEI|nr:MAG: MFS transporter [Candidatus Eisenbacteria bacterium]